MTKSAVACFLLCAAGALAQTQRVQWSVEAAPAVVPPGGTTLVRVTGRIDSGWHMYAASSPTGIPASFKLDPPERFRLFQPPSKRAFDSTQGADAETYEGEVTFILELHLKKDAAAGPAEYNLSARYQTCTSTQCVPGKWTGILALNIDPSARAETPVILPGYKEAKPPAAARGSESWGGFLLVAFGFGLASIFTPCVFPMIPITMSYFLNQQTGTRRDSVMQAVVFCLGIIVLFSGIGLLITVALGPFGVVTLGQNKWVNGFIAALFIVFGLSLLGAFEITIPSAVLTRLNKSSDKGGFAGTLLMGLTFSLASFACVGPFVGTLLAASVSEGRARPLIGMVTFAAGLALPFFLLALFPSYLKRMPRSGGWLARVKVVMGFVILAASLKYLSSLDQVLQLGLLTRERFLAIWIVLFAMAGLYLLGFLRLEGNKADEPVGLWRLLVGMAFLVFAITLAPGMSGGKLGELDAYVPLAEGPRQNALVWMKDQYREALHRARREGKLVFVNFTGYACTNCHWMKANMFTRPEIEAELQKFVLVDLFADGTDEASVANQELELKKFQTIAEPFYAILDPDENVLATFPALTKDPVEYLAFLQKGDAQPAAAGPQFASLDGGPIATAGKVLVVNFWATYCGPCIQEIPSFDKLNREFGPKGVVVLGVSMDEEGASIVKPFLKKHPMEYAVGLGTDADNKQYRLDQLPVTVVFDRAGKQVKRFEGFIEHEDDLKAAVRQAL